MKKLIDMEITEYLDLLKSDAPAPGGGSVSALSGAQGIGLVLMVADLTLAKEKFAEDFEICKEAKLAGEKILKGLTDSIDADTEAFNLVMAAFKMAKESEEEKIARSKAIQAGTLKSTEVPFETMKLAFEGIKVAESLVGNSNPNCASDLGVAMLNLNSCIRGAWLNVLINIGSLKDKEAAEKFRVEGAEMLKEAAIIAKEAVSLVESQL